MTSSAALPLWGHQKDALSFIDGKRAALLHMGLGTGKSLVAIRHAEQLDAQKVLILCPLSVVAAWEKQFREFAPDWTGVYLSKGSVQKKARLAASAVTKATLTASRVVVVVNYESARNDPFASWAFKQQFDLLVMDESHRLKSHKGATSKWVSQLAKTAHTRLALTGTPMPHSTMDIFAQMRALDQRLFGPSFYRFRNKFAKMGGWGGKKVIGTKNEDLLRATMARVTFQATRGVLDLPPAIHETRLVQLGRKGRQVYDQMDRDFCAQVGSGEITAANALVKLLRLQQVTSGYVPVDMGFDSGAFVVQKLDKAKEDALVDLLTDLPPEEPVVVFGRFSGDMATVHAAAKRLKRESLELSGKRKELEDWQAGRAPILSVQIQAGGVGIDLTRACYCVYLSTGFSLGDFEQSLARCHRPGQDRTVFYYHILAENSVDVKVSRALKARKSVVEAILADISIRRIA